MATPRCYCETPCKVGAICPTIQRAYQELADSLTNQPMHIANQIYAMYDRFDRLVVERSKLFTAKRREGIWTNIEAEMFGDVPCGTVGGPDYLAATRDVARQS